MSVDYFQKWKLKLNVDKTDLIIFTHTFEQEKIPDFLINNRVLERKTRIKYFGVNLHSTLSFSIHIEETKKG